ncbi:bifunctional (p)ppGpp synthetase/guanosine-3',5'-bis(diphosphate) 3'-pyrophosphohydrolase [Candidatus Uhrbacteria bacterium]|nr:MAG: bifunctional (p)ppGpp synthetase/guanosine-3',5'-bis(diphosphate) 3'-pyrophosphohydrolase [Candidatus Uhrbacteria bacterium]
MSPKAPAHTVDALVERVRAYDANADADTIRLAYDFAKEAHKEQKRATGEPYIIHPLATAMNLAEMRLPAPIIIAGLLHDVPEDTPRTLEDVRNAFGEDVANMVAGITKLGKIKYRGMERYIENLRKMFLAMAADVRVVFIKFADRLHNLETLDSIPPKKQYRIALESLEIYAPIANRLGMGEMKGRLEDASFKYVLPKEYAWVKEIAASGRAEKEAYLTRIMEKTEHVLRDAGLKDLEVQGRNKHLYSLYRKLLKNERNIARIYDLIAVRVIVDSLADCYAALGIIHAEWTPLKGRIKDYIAQPKPNGYRSLHTTVFCEDGEIVEFQIRTKEMHAMNEYGIAAHWSYDEGGKINMGVGPKGRPPEWVRELAEIQREMEDRKAYIKSLEDLKIDVFKDRIFVFTPKGDVIDLPEDSTCVDFAYAIHTEIGNTTVGAKVNEEVATLDRILKNGDMVEILVDKSRKGPNPDWEKFVKTRNAKSKIRQTAKSSLSSWIKGMLPGK